jgi:hypothetical protein
MSESGVWRKGWPQQDKWVLCRSTRFQAEVRASWTTEYHNRDIVKYNVDGKLIEGDADEILEWFDEE